MSSVIFGLYKNPDDPRIFVYKHETQKWLGVTLNFAHRKSWLYMVAPFGGLLVIFGIMSALCKLDPNSIPAVILLFSYVAVLMWVYYHGAYADLKSHPGNASARPNSSVFSTK